MKYIITLVISLVTFTPHAKSALAPNQDLTGNITFLTGVLANSNNLDVSQSYTQMQSDLSASGSTETSGMLGLLGSLKYTFGDTLNKQLFLGTSQDDVITGTLAFEVGYRQQLEDGTLVDVSFLPTLISGEVWDDPYAIGQKRKETDLSGNVARIQLSRIMGSNFHVDMAAGESDVENEQSGLKGLGLTDAQRALMKRERKYYYFKTRYQHMLNNGSGLLTPSLNVFSSDSEGDALSFFSIGAEISLAKRFNKHGIALTVNADNREYDAVNPIFNKKREDKDLGVFLAYEYSGILGYKDWSAVSFIGARSTESNIEYYDYSQYMMSVGLDFKF
ncbi:DUF2860 family protein [Vibrio sp. 99-70-13A1]|uniref:DUF2860 family protein n=1 Tax=Vibrio sp. 99-70-13A1 TaxID=2607601 RepID=UPI001493649F|nr:DUF2860 family protein [Vibrio sp. 99-70-13A1]NOH98730.1 DUF2860 domain-containing protein [Vibrio sp. 99-70-13A1]